MGDGFRAVAHFILNAWRQSYSDCVYQVVTLYVH